VLYAERKIDATNGLVGRK